jgi:hypothetical protein
VLFLFEQYMYTTYTDMCVFPKSAAGEWVRADIIERLIQQEVEAGDGVTLLAAKEWSARTP